MPARTNPGTRASATVAMLVALLGLALDACSGAEAPPAPPAAPAAQASEAPAKPDPVHQFVTDVNAAGLNLDEAEYRTKLAEIGAGREVCKTGLKTTMDLMVNFRVMDGGTVDKGKVRNAVLNYCDAVN